MTVVLPEAVVAVVLDAYGRALVIRRAPQVPRAGYWMPPSGRIEPGEAAPDAVVREVREELGLTVTPVRKVWECLTDDQRYRLHWWLATHVQGEPTPDPREVSAVQWVAPDGFGQLTPTFADHRAFFHDILPHVPETTRRRHLP